MNATRQTRRLSIRLSSLKPLEKLVALPAQPSTRLVNGLPEPLPGVDVAVAPVAMLVIPATWLDRATIGNMPASVRPLDVVRTFDRKDPPRLPAGVSVLNGRGRFGGIFWHANHDGIQTVEGDALKAPPAEVLEHVITPACTFRHP